ncbi:MAG: DegT/DnrJ/EryC1/StrS family aminotransferase [Flavobacteriales bacterium]|nr:DegT/DnrJ/EryC1/StrS family aminotransferase [Flavobacteriales bacterium]
MIQVTRTFLPPLHEYEEQVKRCWDSGYLSNRGPMVLELEEKLLNRLGIPWVLLTVNGTIPIQIALKLIDHTGEIITTPFSYVATTASIVWEKFKPVFADIEPDTLTIDPKKVESLISPNTRAILATHVFGNPCDLVQLEALANRYGILVIYDAAHAFGVKFRGESIFNYGDISTCSFHATKLFHTGEGGAIFCKESLRHKVYYSHNFGHDGPLQFHGLGINGKMSELQAAMGLSLLPHIDDIISKRAAIVQMYEERLLWSRLSTMKIREGAEWNYSYFPLLLPNESTLLKVQQALNAENIFPRRYFYPSLNTLPYVEYAPMPISEEIASRILCLPLYVGLSESEIDRIASIINNNL